jgi:large subunit ribosomal protein L18
MILSKMHRLTVRISLKKINAQIINPHIKGDKVLVTTNSSELKKYGWKATYGNTPAAYLTGLLLGLKAQTSGIKQAILDMGLKRSSTGSRIFAVLKGVVDSGLDVPYGDVFPENSRIEGEHIASYARELTKVEPELYNRRFSMYLSRNLKPEELPSHFNIVKSNITSTFRKEGE